MATVLDVSRHFCIEVDGHEMGLDEVSGADFWCNLHSFRRPVVLEGFRGQLWGPGGRKFKILPPRGGVKKNTYFFPPAKRQVGLGVGHSHPHPRTFRWGGVSSPQPSILVGVPPPTLQHAVVGVGVPTTPERAAHKLGRTAYSGRGHLFIGLVV